jgi:hypothetical protein
MTYSDLKNIWADIKSDKIMRILARIFGMIVIFFSLIVVFKSLTQPISIFGIEMNKNLIKHDTIYEYSTVNIHDTFFIPTGTRMDRMSNGNSVGGKTNVTSYDQKGGQTAGQINNNR